jgi:hypothetical protein
MASLPKVIKSEQRADVLREKFRDLQVRYPIGASREPINVETMRKWP